MSGVVEAEAVTTRPEPRRTRRAGAWRRLLRQPVAVGAGLVLAVVLVVGAIAPLIAPSPRTVHIGGRWINHAPMLSGWHVLGTDNLGRDMLVRTLYGLHTSEQSALLATLLATLVGVVLGGIAGYRGGWTDSVIMRFGDMLGVFPALMLLLVAYTYFFPVTVGRATVIFAFYLWIQVARVVRAEFASLRTREFVQAAHSLGASDRRIFLRHLLPNGSSTIIVAATSLLGQVLVLEATLEFFGLAVPSAVQPTLGNLIGDAQSGSLAYGLGWWTLVTPAGLLILILVCVNLLGDGVADALRATGRR
jgi:ABC-type dipeptide/oligopeptide/nickel transport system permease subunit